MLFTKRLWQAMTAPDAHRLSILDTAVTAVLEAERGPVVAYFVVLRVRHHDTDDIFELMFRIDPDVAATFHERLGIQLTTHRKE